MVGISNVLELPVCAYHSSASSEEHKKKSDMKGVEKRAVVVSVLASPLRHKIKANKEAPMPLVSRNLKQGGMRRILHRNHMMELEVSTLKRRILASKENQKKMKADMREQRDQTYKIISRVAQVLEDKENQIQELHAQKESELSKLSRELLILHSNMLKERSRLTGIISELSSKVTCQDSEIKKLKKRLSFQTSSSLAQESPTSDLDAHSPPSSEESSPKSTSSCCKTPPKTRLIQQGSFKAPQPSVGKPPIPSRVGVNRKINYRLKEMRMKDEGFFSSYEEGPYPRNSPHPNAVAKRTMSFQHSLNVKSIGNFGALEELNVVSGGQTSEKTPPTTIIRYLDYL